MAKNESIEIDLVMEGPDIVALGLVALINQSASKCNYNLDKLSIVGLRNVIQPKSNITICQPEFPFYFAENTRNKMKWVEKNIQYTFGCFIGRSNLHRLFLSSYLFKNYADKTLQTFHYNKQDDFQSANVSVTELINYYGPEVCVDATKFLTHCPMTLDQQLTYPILMDQHYNLQDSYNKFFLEIVCETYFTGTTFFPTEKIWRAVATGTPFIVQGPKNFLSRLQRLGFETFQDFWPESYTLDFADNQATDLVKIIDWLGIKSLEEIQDMYQSMLPILKHNYNRFQELSDDDIKIFVESEQE